MSTNDCEFSNLARIAHALETKYSSEDLRWLNSPFAWIRSRPSRQVGAIGEQLVEAWLVAKGFDIQRPHGSDADRLIDGVKTEIKFSTLWHNGRYKFQQLRDQDYEMVICLGISPQDAHLWALPKSEIMRQWHELGNIRSQHAGARGSDTAWLDVNPLAPPDWLRVYGGSLIQGLRVISCLTGRA